MITIKTTEISDIEDVRSFFEQLCDNAINFHPDDDFTEYVECGTDEFSFSREEALRLNALMARCFEVCDAEGEDIYQLAIDADKKLQEELDGTPQGRDIDENTFYPMMIGWGDTKFYTDEEVEELFEKYDVEFGLVPELLEAMEAFFMTPATIMVDGHIKSGQIVFL